MNHKLALGVTVRRHRQRLGLSQEQLAKRAGLHRTYIGSIERGERNITLVNILRLAQGLEMDIVKLCEDMLAQKDRTDRHISSTLAGLSR
ncbi:MAG TPA: helix-turn-helix transcriptional regulator [bacterium]|nr:helix-turn-helix transcriptional regulator [bacterium]